MQGAQHAGRVGPSLPAESADRDPRLNPSARKQSKSPAAKTAVKKKDRIARPMNSFMIFARDFRAEMREKHPNIDNKEISKMLGQKWKSLNPDEKKIYYDKATAVAEQHKKDHPDWKFIRAPPRKGGKAKGASDSSGGSGGGRKPRASSGVKGVVGEMEESVSAGNTGVTRVGPYGAALQPKHLESLRDLHVAQSKLMMEQQEMEIAVMMAGQVASPREEPPIYVPPPPLKEMQHPDSVFLSAMELAMMAHPPSAVRRPTVHPTHIA